MIQAPEVADVRADFCTLDPQSLRSNLKMLFVIDRSGSNGQTDPDRSRRFQSILDFLAQPAPTNSGNLFFNYISFQGAGVVRGFENFTSDRAAFAQYIQTEYSAATDSNATPYKAAMSEALTLIRADIELAKKAPTLESSFYAIFFISDGQPTDDPSPFNGIRQSVDTLVELQKLYPQYVDGLQVHTGLYYTPASGLVPAAQELLQDMARRGNGVYVEFGNGEKINFNLFVIPDRHFTVGLQDVFVHNMNALWSGTGTLVADLDKDGLSDIDEGKAGSDPFNADSDGNGVDDGVEQAIFGRPCSDRSCAATSSTSLYGCSSLGTGTGANRFPDTDKDGLNDCEEYLLGSKYSETKDFDTNGDWVPDWLAFINKMSVLPTAGDAAQLDPDWDDVNNYTEVKRNTPTTLANNKIVNIRPYEYDLTTVTATAERTCYTLKVSNVMTVGAGNSIRIYIEESTRVGKDARFVRVAEKALDASNSVQFRDTDFK